MLVNSKSKHKKRKTFCNKVVAFSSVELFLYFCLWCRVKEAKLHLANDLQPCKCAILIFR